MGGLVIDDYAPYPQVAAFRFFRVLSRAHPTWGGVSVWSSTKPRDSRSWLTRLGFRGSGLEGQPYASGLVMRVGCCSLEDRILGDQTSQQTCSYVRQASEAIGHHFMFLSQAHNRSVGRRAFELLLPLCSSSFSRTRATPEVVSVRGRRIY